MTSPAFIVEGKQERIIIQKLCGGKFPIQILNANGENVTPQKIAEKIDFILSSFSNRFFPIIIVLDREKREISAEKLMEKIKAHLVEMGHDIGQFIFGIPDRKIEAWILPFVDESGNYSQEPTGDFEGKNCLGELERRLGKQDIIYEKTTVGPELFCSINPLKLAGASKSFSLFFEQAGKFCWWLNENR